MVHHLTDIQQMYASKAAEAGLIIRKRRWQNRRKEDIKHEDLCNMLARQIEVFIHKEYPDAVYCKVHVWVYSRKSEEQLLELSMSMNVVFQEVPLQENESYPVRFEKELTQKVFEELRDESNKGLYKDICYVCSVSGMPVCTVKQWNDSTRLGLERDLGQAIWREFPKNHDYDISLTDIQEDEFCWDLTLTLVCDSLGPFDDDTKQQHQLLDQLLKGKMVVYNKVLIKEDCLHLLRNVHILPFTKEMWKYRTHQKKEWEAFERAKTKRISSIINDMVNKLEKACKSDSISLESLQETTKLIPSKFVSGSCFLHQACLNKNVTLEIIEYLLEYHPEAANIEYTDPPRGYYDDDNCQIMKKAYPLHVACMSEACPDSVIQLLVERNPTVLTKLCLLNNGISYEYNYDNKESI